MRRLFLVVLLSLLAAVGLVALIESDPGYILISYGLTTIETSLWVGLLLLVVFNLLFYVGLRLLRKLLATRGVISDWLGLHRHCPAGPAQSAGHSPAPALVGNEQSGSLGLVPRGSGVPATTRPPALADGE